MIHKKILDKFDEYQHYCSNDAAMVCAVLDVRLWGLMNCLPEGDVMVASDLLKKVGVMNG